MVTIAGGIVLGVLALAVLGIVGWTALALLWQGVSVTTDAASFVDGAARRRVAVLASWWRALTRGERWAIRTTVYLLWLAPWAYGFLRDRADGPNPMAPNEIYVWPFMGVVTLLIPGLLLSDEPPRRHAGDGGRRGDTVDSGAHQGRRGVGNAVRKRTGKAGKPLKRGPKKAKEGERRTSRGGPNAGEPT